MLLKENPSLVFEGGTDTEVVAKLIGEMWAKEPKLGLKEIGERANERKCHPHRIH